MTDATGDAGHPDVAEISDLAEGLLDPSRSGELRSHLDSCALCADVRSSLEEIRGLLGTLPGPSRMPADVAGRIDAALAAEALLETMEPPAGSSGAVPSGSAPQGSATPGESAQEPSDEDPVADVSRETSGDVSRETSRETTAPESLTHPSPPGTTAPLETAATEEEGDQEAGPSGATASPTGSAGRRVGKRPVRPGGHGRGPAGPGRKGGSRANRRRLILSSVLAAAALGLGAVLVPALTDAGSGGDDTAASADAGPVYSDRSLKNQVSDLLLETGPGGGRQEKRAPGALEKDEKSSLGVQSSPETPELNEPLMGTGPEVPPCVERGIERTEPALALERGRFQGTDAFLVVLPDHEDSARVTAYLVDATCVDGGDEPGDVLLTRTYPKP
ncbi:hypothetical protein [Streptomyces sp. NPDC058374]|uniref:hypothetical protein n=1 Tax=unclassified Streptomyces TaxID=2593676 RepID=UPI0036627B37